MSNAKKLMQGASGVSTATPKTVAVSMGSDGATAIDISDATNMSQLDDHFIACNYSLGRGVDETRSIAFVTGFLDINLVAIDVSNPSSLSTLDNLTESTNFLRPYQVAVDPNIEIAFVGSSGSNLAAVDYSTPSSLTIAVNNSTSTNTQGLVIDTDNKRLYGGEPFKSFTYDSSGNVTLADTLSGSSNNHQAVIDLKNNQVYTCDNNDTILSIDIADHTNLVEDDEFVPAVGADIEAIDHDENKNVLLALDTDAGKVYSIDTSNPASLSVSDTLTDSNLVNSNFASDIRVDKAREIAFVSIRSGNILMSIDYSNPSSLSILQTFSDGDIDGGTLVLFE